MSTEVHAESAATRKGWFSRRHRTSEAHVKAQQAREIRETDWRDTMQENERARAKRSPEQQLALLDKRLGKGVGAKKERARLLAQIEGRKSAPKKRRKRRRNNKES